MIKKIINNSLRKVGYKIQKVKEYKSSIADITRLKGAINNYDEVKLHFGCGARVLKDWINIDLFYEPFENYLQYYEEEHYPESIRGNKIDFFAINILDTGLPLANDSVDLIFHEDFFEHINQRDQFVFLAETLRVMKEGAVHRINTPNIAASMRDNSSFNKGKDGVYVGEWNNWHHLSIMSPKILEEMALMVGYSKVVFNSKNKSMVAEKLPKEYRPDAKDRPAPDSNVFADLIK